jgi:hypothetical protein
MTRTIGSKNLSFHDRVKTCRKTPLPVAEYTSFFVDQHRELIELLTRDDYITYEKILHSWGKEHGKEKMIQRCIDKNFNSTIISLANLRHEDSLAHQKVLQMIRHRWTFNYEIK